MMNLVPLERLTADAGHAFRALLPDAARNCLHNGGLSLLLEDDRALLPGEAMHAEIRAKGAGAFSVWDTTVYFSASDNSDCNGNGRRYSARRRHAGWCRPRYGGLNSLAKCDGALLALVGRSLDQQQPGVELLPVLQLRAAVPRARHGVAQLLVGARAFGAGGTPTRVCASCSRARAAAPSTTSAPWTGR